MKRIHVWANHIRIVDLDLVLPRPREEPLAHSLMSLARLGFDTRLGNVEIHDEPESTSDRLARGR
jgi:hypothetical protein